MKDLSRDLHLPKLMGNNLQDASIRLIGLMAALAVVLAVLTSIIK